MAAVSEGLATAAPAKKVVSPWNPANAVTASRFLTLPFFFWAVQHGYHQWATLLMLGCGLLDKLDGLVARIFNCRSAFGELFDAITDALCYGFGLVVVAAYGWAPAIPVIGVIALGIANSVMRGIYVKRAGRTTNYKSYAMERLVAYTGYLIGFATAGFEVTYFYWLFLPTMIVILLYDSKRMLVDPIPAPIPEAS
ncbi:MAG: CDP-alcohol phosphatidyltransferase family protein [Kofleriaceae bacterium]